jgi:hypothetical protein
VVDITCSIAAANVQHTAAVFKKIFTIHRYCDADWLLSDRLLQRAFGRGDVHVACDCCKELKTPVCRIAIRLRARGELAGVRPSSLGVNAAVANDKVVCILGPTTVALESVWSAGHDLNLAVAYVITEKHN